MSQVSRGGPESFQKIFSVSRETISKLEIYAQLLEQWQSAVQLIAPSTLSNLWIRHFADSAQLMFFSPPVVNTWIDLGSGGGFPGLILALMGQDPSFQSEIKRIILIESDTRKAAFLREVARQLGVVVDILCGRIETLTTQATVGKGDVISARACAPLDVLLGYTFPYCKPKTMGLFLKGSEVQTEINKANQLFMFKLELKPSVSDPTGQIVKIWDLEFKGEGKALCQA